MIKSVLTLVDQALTSVEEINSAMLFENNQQYQIIDVREKEEAEHGMLPNAFHISKGLLEFQILNHPKLKTLSANEQAKTNILLYCRSGQRSILASKSLQDMGFKNVFSLKGGYLAWQQFINKDKL